MGGAVEERDFLARDNPPPVQQPGGFTLAARPESIRHLADHHQLDRAGLGPRQALGQAEGILQPNLIATPQPAFDQEQASAVRGQVGGAERMELGQVDPVIHNPPGGSNPAVNGLPPVAGETALVNDRFRQPAPGEAEDEVIPFRTQEMSRAGMLEAVDPVHAVEALDKAQALAAGAEKIINMAGGSDDQDSLAGWVIGVLVGADAAPGQPGGETGAERGRAPQALQAGQDANGNLGGVGGCHSFQSSRAWTIYSAAWPSPKGLEALAIA